MAQRFKNIDRNIPLLLPADLRDWVAEDDLVHFVIAAVERLPLAKFQVNERGCGDEQYPPHVLLALLIYCYANGIFSSRRIERATYRDIAVRYLCADTHPDHDTICAFRRHNFEAFAAAFVDVLEMAHEMKLLKLGCVSVDGTQLKASASKDKNVTYERATQLRAQLRLDVQDLLQQAEQADHQDHDAQQLPKEIARRQKLFEKMACTGRMLTLSGATTTGRPANATSPEPSPIRCSSPWPPSSRPLKDARNIDDVLARSNRSSASSNRCSASASSCCVDSPK